MAAKNVATLVVDNGSRTCRAGFAGKDLADVEFPTVIGQRRNQGAQTKLSQEDYYVGNVAQQKRGILNIKCPIERGIVTNWDDMEKIWHHMFFKELKVVPQEHHILLTSPLETNGNVEKLSQIMFERFNFPALFISSQVVLSLYAAGSTEGIALYSGDGVTQTAVVQNGYIMPETSLRLDLAGRDLTNQLMKNLAIRGKNDLLDENITRDIKEKLCYVALDFNKEMAKPLTSVEKSYKLPDGQMIIVGNELFKCSEALFQPTLVNLKSSGIHQLVHTSIMRSGKDVRNKLFGNIFLSGGSTLFPGMVERMQKELQLMVPASTKIKILVPPARVHSVWIGGSILASLSTFQQILVKKEEYEEYGPSFVKSKLMKNQVNRG